ncbi:MAG TPA: hypothetical protein VI316_13305 [Candidatus Dormibacteraeota bacterium]
MSEFRDRLSDTIRDHADFTVSLLALVILTLCAVTWLWARQTRLLRRQLARERAAQRAMLPAPSAAVMAAVASTNGHREVQREGRPVYSVAREEAPTPAAAAPVAQDSLGWVLPAAAGAVVAAAAADPPAPLEDVQSEEPGAWAPLSEPAPPEAARPELEAAASAAPAAWALPATAAPALAWSPPAPASTSEPEPPRATFGAGETEPDPLLVEDDENASMGWSLRTPGSPTSSSSTS